ncbi:non-ribosomal peptide synthetase [Paenibacillus popilliae]|uniref:Amino acid adenylation domain-containing protein n=1 Tax=Paenibacillus popilliae TaxID=78057 RepID=A0ABY3AXU9_PAEPP|nr:non-ribosomal peptide synthetase [Paenibacillus sp. SDF0028]TQR46022.1 amino acid adenylation domain-containing protein [Paenibacillus sp. SDF0028]
MIIPHYADYHYPLSHPQKRIWYTEKLYPNTNIHHICGIANIYGQIDADMLMQSIRSVIAGNQAFRLVISEEDDGPVQTVSKDGKHGLQFTDFSTKANPQQVLDQWLQNQLRLPLSLDRQQPLYRFEVYRLDEKHYGIFAKIHHLIFDGWSLPLLTAEICNHYERLFRGEDDAIQEDQTYLQLINQEQKYAQSPRFAKDRAYWYEKFQTIPEPVFHMGSDRLEAQRASYALDREIISSIHDWTQKYNCSLNDYFVLLMNLYIFKMYGQTDVTIGLPVYNRSGPADKQTIGMYTSTMPVPFHIQPEAAVLELLSAVKREIRTGYVHQKYPFDLLMQDLQLKKRGYESLFQLSVNYYPFVPSNQLLDQPFEVIQLHSGYQQLPLQLVIKEWAEGELMLEFDYRCAIFSKQDIDLMFDRIMRIATQIMNHPQLMIQQISLLSEDERYRLLVEFNDTTQSYPANHNVVELFEQQVQLTPERIAISMYTKTWNYQELHRQVLRLSVRLRQLGIGSGHKVGVYGTHSMELVAGVLAILKVGAAYVPIDHAYPSRRINDILQDSTINCMVLNRELPADVDYSGTILWPEQQDEDDAAVWNITGPSAGPSELAYMIYTSGSTGKPKGVMIEHSNLTNYIWWAHKVYVRQTPEVFALYSSLSFDLTVTSIFTPLIGGHELRIYSESDHGFVLYDILRDNKVTVLKLTPAHLSLLREQSYTQSSIRTLIVGGENLNTSIAKEINDCFGANIHIYNEYGPTEATVGCMIHKYDPLEDTDVSVPIGKPAANVQLYVLDEHLQPVPTGCIGELFISGEGVARGYWNREQLSEAAFVPNPFLSQQKMYRTGDLVRFTERNHLEYMGRKDRQVKLNGYRIEIGEIEAALLEIDEISNAAVLGYRMNDAEHTDQQTVNAGKSDQRTKLCAYLVMKTPVELAMIKTKLAAKLPLYMIPQLIEVNEIPLTINGKIDFSKLPVPIMELEVSVESNKDELQYLYSVEQQLLTDTLQQLLNIPVVRLEHEFFQLGGDSIKAIQLSSRMKTAGYVLKVNDILTYSRIGDMVAYLVKDRGADQEDRHRIAEGVLKRSPIHEWFFDQQLTQQDYYHQSVLLSLDASVTLEMIESGLQALIVQHDSLRLNLNDDRVLFYNPVHLDLPFQVQQLDLSSLSYDQQLERIEAAGSTLKSSFDLQSDLLFKAIFFELGSQGARLLLTAHHLVVDGVSWRILLEDLITILTAKKDGREAVLPAKTSSYQQWTEELEHYAASLTSTSISYWNEIFDDWSGGNAPNVRAVENRHTATVTKRLSADWTSQWLLHANSAYHTEPVDLLIIALAQVVQQLDTGSCILLELEGHGRERFSEAVDVSRTVGWFTSIFPVRIELPAADLEQQIKLVKEQLRNVPNKGFDYLISRHLQPSSILSMFESPIGQMIRFNYLGDFVALSAPGLFALAEEQTGPNNGLFNAFSVRLDVNAMTIGGQLRLSVTYAKEHFTTEAMNQLIHAWHDQLIAIITHCTARQSATYTPSDFETIGLDQAELDSLLID